MEGEGRERGGGGREGEGTLQFCPPYLNFLATPLIITNYHHSKVIEFIFNKKLNNYYYSREL